MIRFAFLETIITITDKTVNFEESNLDAKQFYEILAAAN